MNYFTPQLISVMQSTDDEVLDDFEEKWEDAGEKYAAYLTKVRGQFTRGLRRMVNRYYLHDAEVFRLGQQDRSFRIELQLDTPPHSFLTFRYRLLRPAQIDRESLPPECRSKGSRVDWLYSEIEQASAEEILGSSQASTWVKDEWLTSAHTCNGEREWPFWIHRILLSNGWEVTLHFRDVRIEEYEDLLTPVSRDGEKAVSTTAS